MKRRTMAFGGLLMAVAVTGYSVSGTYAKYISSIDVADDARVAKWDFNTDQKFDLFTSSYSLTNAEGNKYTYVQSLNCNAEGVCDEVVAPGTHGTATIEISGQTETNYKLSFDVKDYYNNVVVPAGVAGNDTGKNYSPVIFNVRYFDETGYQPVSEMGTDLEAVLTKINEKLEGMVFAPDADGNAKHFLEISWSWAFDKYDYIRFMEATATGNDASMWNLTEQDIVDRGLLDTYMEADSIVNDKLDTVLGERAADKKGEALTVGLTVSAVIEQTKLEANY